MARGQKWDKEVVQMTSRILRDQCSRQFERVTPLLDDDVKWIGPLDFQWSSDLEGFRALIQPEQATAPITLTDEEYHLLGHDKNTWIVYGRLRMNARMDDGRSFPQKLRVTFVWRRENECWKVQHMHVSSAYDFPNDNCTPYEAGKNFFQYVSQFVAARQIGNDNDGKLLVKDCSGCCHYLYQAEIICIKAEKPYCHIVLPGRSIRIHEKISTLEQRMDKLIRVHKSYLANPAHVTGFSLYRLKLSNGVEIPVSREKYRSIKQQIKDLPQPTLL